MIVLFENQTANGTSAEQRISRRDIFYRFTASGVFDTATVSLSVQDPFGNWVELASLTAAEAQDVRLRSGDIVKADLSSVGATTSITAALKPIGS